MSRAIDADEPPSLKAKFSDTPRFQVQCASAPHLHKIFQEQR